MQRLYSTFPDGWPGTGLVFLRAVAAVPPIQHAIATLMTGSLLAPASLQFVAVCSATLLAIGLWTPIAGAAMALVELFLAFTYPADLWMHITAGAVAAALAMLGPGAWSVDARLFGRKRIEIPLQ